MRDEEIGHQLKRLRGEEPSGRVFGPDYKLEKPKPEPLPMIAAPWFGGPKRARRDGWRDEQSQTPITDILRGR